jgi:hypothetical protein
LSNSGTGSTLIFNAENDECATLNPAMSACRPDALFSRHRRLLRTILGYVAAAVALAA